MVSTSDKALSCTECHSKDGRLKKPNDFYLPGRNYSSLIDTGGVIFMILVLLGVIVHGFMRIVSSKKTTTLKLIQDETKYGYLTKYETFLALGTGRLVLSLAVPGLKVPGLIELLWGSRMVSGTRKFGRG